MEPYSRIKLMRLIVLAGFGLALLYYAIAPGWLVPNTYPHSTFLYNPGDRHHDFWQTYHWTRTLQPYATKQANYFPFTFVAMIPFSILKGLPSLILFLGTIVLFMLRYLHENLPREPRGILQGLNVLTFSVLTYPLLFLLDRANVEGLVLILMVIFFDKYSRGKIRGSLPFLAGAIA